MILNEDREVVDDIVLAINCVLHDRPFLSDFTYHITMQMKTIAYCETYIN